jgi:transposase InsO family protein
MPTHRPGESLERACRLLDRWTGWVEELEDHPLDSFEYEAALECRGDLGDALVVAGDDRLWDRADEIGPDAGRVAQPAAMANRLELANAIFEYLEIFHNRQRRHSSLGMFTPIEYERRHQSSARAQAS